MDIESLHKLIDPNQALLGGNTAALLEDVLRFANAGIWYYRPHVNDFIGVGDLFKQLEGAENKYIDRNFILTKVHPEDGDLVNDLFTQASLHKIAKGDVRVTNRFGEILNLSLEIVGRTDEEGYTYYSGYAQDVTTIKAAQQEQFASHTRYMQIFLQSKDAIFITVRDGQIFDCNDAATELLGYSRHQFVNMTMNELYVNPQDREHLLLLVDKHKMVKDYQALMAHKNGEQRTCEINISHIGFGAFSGYHCIVRDITEKINSIEIARAREIAEKSAQLKEDFIANLSHEIRTPLNAVLGICHLISKTSMTAEQQEYIETIQYASENLLGIINEVLDSASFQTGKIVLDNRPFDIWKAVVEIANLFQPKAKEKNIQLLTELDPQLPRMVKGDLTRFHQVLVNLVNNAIKFTDKGHVKISVDFLSSPTESSYFIIQIEDTGEGIPEEKLSSIFEKYVQLSHNVEKQYLGKGLGLAIVKQLVELMGGSISVSSRENEGTVFSLCLPFETKPQQQLYGSALPTSDRAVTAPQRIRILIAEDNQVSLNVVCRIIGIEWPEAKIYTAGNGREVIDTLLDHDIDILLLDLEMPVMDGLETSSYIRKYMTAPKQSIPIIAFTAHRLRNDDERLVEAGVNDLIMKPFQPDTLFQTILSLLPLKSEEPDYRPDLTYLSQMVDDDEDMIKEIIGMLLTTVPQEIAGMKKCLENNDYLGIRQACHKLRTTFAFVGNPYLLEINTDISTKVKADESPTVVLEAIERMDSFFSRCASYLITEQQKLEQIFIDNKS